MKAVLLVALLAGCFAGRAGLDEPAVVPDGFVGEKLGRLFAARLECARARGDIFDETVNAFRTHYDDRHALPPGPSGPSGFWQGEYWGKTMLSYAAHQRLSHDRRELDFIHAQAGRLVETFQQPDGYLATYANPDFIVGWNWNIWGRKYTLWALIEAYDLTHDGKLLDAAKKMVRHLSRQLDRRQVSLAETGCFAGLPSMSILKPLVLLYARCGDETALKLAQGIVADNDRADGRKPNLIANAFTDKPVHAWYPESWEWAKAYELMSCAEGLVEYARVMNVARPLEAAKRLFDKLATDELNALESVGYHDKFSHAAHRPNAISEVCDVIHWMRLCRCLYEATGDGKYLDRWERAFLNAYLAGIYRDGAWGAHDVRSHGRRHLQGVYEVKMLHHFCCLDNAPRAAVDWCEQAVVRCAPDVVDVNFYTDGTYRMQDVSVTVAGNYPVGDRVTVAVTAPRPLRVNLRVPDWAKGMTVDGRPATPARHVVELSAAGTHRLALAFDMRPRLVRWAGADDGADDVKLRDYLRDNFEMTMHDPEMAGLLRTKPGMRLLRGPLVLAKCLRAGNDDRTCLDDLGIDESWQVSLTPERPSQTWGRWRAVFVRDAARKSVGVSDFASAADSDDWHNCFSIWF